jgi:hypothetical protein
MIGEADEVDAELRRLDHHQFVGRRDGGSAGGHRLYVEQT